MKNYEAYQMSPLANFKSDSIRLLAHQLEQLTYPGYPSQRLVTDVNKLRNSDGAVDIPSGPWDTDRNSPLPSFEERQHFQNMNLELDAQGRPLHPWIDDITANERIGIITGKGAYWNWGPNYTADPIILRSTQNGLEVALIQRSDTGSWALPGGFIDSNEASLATAVREAYEETGLDISKVADQAQQIYQGPMADLRATAHAWPETSAFVFDVTNIELPPPRGMDDAQDAAWVPVQECVSILYGSHGLLVSAAGENYGTIRNK